MKSLQGRQVAGILQISEKSLCIAEKNLDERNRLEERHSQVITNAFLVKTAVIEGEVVRGAGRPVEKVLKQAMVTRSK